MFHMSHINGSVLFFLLFRMKIFSSLIRVKSRGAKLFDRHFNVQVSQNKSVSV